MATRRRVRRGIERAAVGRVLEYLHAQRRNGRLIFPLAELSEETALDPNTVEAAMAKLERTGPFEVHRLGAARGELRWRVEGSVYDLDGWESDVWNAG